MAKLNQILAIEKHTKTAASEALTAIYHAIQKEPLLSGIARTYKPRDEEGERFPAESTQVQVRVEELLKLVAGALSPLVDVTAQRDLANCEAMADVVVDGQLLMSDVPATYLLWLEKQLVDLQTLIKKLPTLPQAEAWEFNANHNCYASVPSETAKTKKIPKPFVKYEATDKHPAQVEVVHEDVLQGYWTTTKFSGAIPATRAKELRERVEKLLVAVKFAREQANMVDVQNVSFGARLFGYLFA